jgi:hypothetical protein
MSKLKLWGILGVLSTLSAALAMIAWGQQVPLQPLHHPDELGGLMRAKLASSQKVVEGLMAADFDLIRKGGEELSRICDATQWRSRDDQLYGQYRSEMRRSAQKLIQMAAEKNLSGSAYTYMHSLNTCINCHEHCRDVLHVATKGPDFKVVPIPATEQENSLERMRPFRR